MTSTIQLHKCKQLEDNQNKPFNILLEIQKNELIVFDTFTPITEKEFRKQHPDAYSIDIKFCPFCGLSTDNKT